MKSERASRGLLPLPVKTRLCAVCGEYVRIWWNTTVPHPGCAVLRSIRTPTQAQELAAHIWKGLMEERAASTTTAAGVA